MATFKLLPLLLLQVLLIVSIAEAESPYRYFDWNITYALISPLGIPQQGILINGEFPGPVINCTTNDNIIVNVHNQLPEPFLLSWNGIQQRKDSFQDGVSGTNCPIPPGENYTYHMQVKDQIGSFFYFPSLAFHKAAGGFGGINVNSRPLIPVPFPPPAGDFTLLVGDWYGASHQYLKMVLDSGRMIMSPDALLINGNGQNNNAPNFTVEPGKTYRLRISNVGLESSLNFRIQGHIMKLVEVEGTHTIQNEISSLDIHVGQSYSVLVTADQPVSDYYIAVSTRFTDRPLTTTAVLHYNSSVIPPSGYLPPVPDGDPINWSMNQARSIRTNLTASGPRPNPQGSYHYGLINVTRNIKLVNSPGFVSPMRQRYAVNGVSFIPSDTPLKLADYFNITGVFQVGSIPDQPPGNTGQVDLRTSVMGADHRTFMEIVFENHEDIIQSWHLDGYAFFVVGMDAGSWKPESRENYNLHDAVSRSTTQVYPRSWTAVYVSLDNVGMWNLRSEFWARQYLGQQFYLRVWTPVKSLRNEYPIPRNALLCGRATHLH